MTASTTTGPSRARSSRCATNWRGCTATRNYADYALVDRMAGTPAAVAALLAQVWEPAKARAATESDALRATALAHGATHPIEPWDWRYYAEKVRKAHYGFDDAALKPYFALDRMLDAAFDTASRLFGIRFIERPRSAGLSPGRARLRGARARRQGGRHLPVRQLRAADQARRRVDERLPHTSRGRRRDAPIIVNNNNFAKGAPGEPTLLSADDARTLFHEFGHGLHGLLSKVTYERLSGHQRAARLRRAAVADLRALGDEPEVLKRHALPLPHRRAHSRRADRQAQGGAALQPGLRDRASTPPARWSTWRCMRATDVDGVDISEFERTELARIGMPREIVLRHRLPHFRHLFSGTATRRATTSTCGPRCSIATASMRSSRRAIRSIPTVARAPAPLHLFVRWSTLDPAAAFRAFRGRDPVVGPMLASRGLVDTDLRQPA